MAAPQRVVTNEELSQVVDTTDEWIESHTGIRERRIASDGETTASLALTAGLRALEIANVKPGELDLIIVATCTPEHLLPATACLVQDRLGATKAGAFDLSAACSGFIFALNMATQAIRSGSIQCALVIGAETLSRMMDWTDRNTCILFGDGAGAFVLQAAPEPGGVLASVMRSDGSGGDLLMVPAGGSFMPPTLDTVTTGKHFVQMNGREVFRFATRVMGQATEQVVNEAGFTLDQVELIVPHQANLRILQAAAKNMKIPIERCMINLDRYGNTSAASIPLAVCEAIQQGRLKRGDKVVFVGFGGGLTWGAAAAIWNGPLPGVRKARPLRYQMYARLSSFIKRLLRRIDAMIWGRNEPYV
jgi:3-oxoacyl-[acyl-carrier-protein] synthase-3